MFKDNIKMNIKEMALMTSGLNFIWSIYKLKFIVISHDICYETDEYLAQLI